MENVLKVLTSIWFIILVMQVLTGFGAYIVELPDYLLVASLLLFSVFVIHEFRKGIVRELEKDSSER
ncbi:hypothetical protein [Bacillus piscicola]|uniref:hypothetical protein n=1 Tax=Bacillus piscicola TaxID=1632684 RepID=UPI001F08BF7E|nr:hypothetical protein [Bacillus piscicola]